VLKIINLIIQNLNNKCKYKAMNIGMYGMVTESSYYSNSNTNHPHHHHHVANNYDMNSVQHQTPSQPSQVYYTSVLDTTYTSSAESPYYNNTTEREEIITSDNGLSYTNLDASGYTISPSYNQQTQYNYAGVESYGGYSGEHYHRGASDYAIQDTQHSQVTYATTGAHQVNTRQVQVQQQPAVPTYKWMQVKRNVPKPGNYGNYIINYKLLHIEIKLN
jgi:hypothetical protein